MQEGFEPWPDEFDARFRSAGVWHDRSLLDFVREPLSENPKAPVMVAEERCWTRGELWEVVRRRAEGLRRAGLDVDDRVVLQLPNSSDFVLTFLAMIWAGVTPVLALPGHRRAELRHVASTAGARGICVSSSPASDVDFVELARQVSADVESLDLVIVDGQRVGDVALDDIPNDECRDPHVPAPTDIALFLLSGGTTGLPKLIARTHTDYTYNIEESSRVSDLGEHSRYLVALLAGHNFPLGCPGLLGTIANGGVVIMSPSPSVNSVFPTARKYQPTITAVVPAVAISWMDEADRSALASLDVLQVGGARLNPEVAKDVGSRLGCTLQQVFGMAEGLLNYTRLDDSRDVIIHTQGRKISELDEIRIVSEDGEPVAVGEVGELLTRGPYTIRGYFSAPDHNERSFTADGFYRTGDLVRADVQGNLVVEGRSKDHINRGGEKISAEEIENYVLAHPAVVNSAAIGIPDQTLGARICVIAELSDELSLDDLREHFARSGVATFKFPEFLEIVDALPLTNVGKVDKALLRETYSVKGQ